MRRNTIYTIGKNTFKNQQVGDILNIELKDTEEVVDENQNRFYTVLFGIDDKGARYMALVTKEYGISDWHGAYKSGGHWHGSGYSIYTMGYNVKLRKNFKDADEANKYYKIVKTNMHNRTVSDSEDPNRRFTEEQINVLFK